jgi:hypothetical protein
LTCFQLQENISSHLTMCRPIFQSSGFKISKIFGARSVVILKICSYHFLFAIMAVKMNIFNFNVCLYFVFDLGECIQLLDIGLTGNLQENFQIVHIKMGKSKIRSQHYPHSSMDQNAGCLHNKSNE